MQSMTAEDEIAVIITLKDQLDVTTLTEKKPLAKGLLRENKRLHRAAINKALRSKADQSQKPLASFLKQKNARNIKPFWIFNGMAVTVRPTVVDEIASRLDVISVRLDDSISLPTPSPADSAIPEWNLDAIQTPSLWARGYSGSGVVVATMDTGVDYLHPDIATKWRGGSNSWFDPHNEHATPYDQTGHGTQVMGILVGGDAGGTSIGVAPNAQWIAVKMFDDAGLAYYSDIHQGYQWLLDPDNNPNTDDLPDIVNNSWGYDTLVDQCLGEFIPDIQALKAAGVAVVVAAGNVGPSSSTSISPANYPESFAVGSVDQQLQIANTSSRGPATCDGTFFPEIVAPGVNVKSTDLTFGGLFPNSYATVSGTSFAAPHVSGTMALLLSAMPQLTVAELESALMATAIDLGDSGPDNVYGYGMLDALGAYNALHGFPWLLFMPAITIHNNPM